MTTETRSQDGASTVPMEFLQAALEAGKLTEELILVIQGHEITIRWRQLTWLEKSEVLSLALEYTAVDGKDGPELQAKLRHDIFRREALKRMIVESPIPITSDKVLDNLPAEIGEQLEKIIPSPFSSEQATTTKKE